MSRPATTLYTQEQIILILNGWGYKEALPPKGFKLYICFPEKSPGVDLAVVEKTSLKSEYGKQLWQVTMSSREGREFDASVQEAHVLAYRENRIQQQRCANQASLLATA